MKRSLIIFLFLLIIPVTSHAQPVFFGWGGEKIIKVADFPDTDLFKRPDGQYLEVGYRFKQVTIFFIPLWNYDGEWCGYIGKDDEYVDLKREDL